MTWLTSWLQQLRDTFLEGARYKLLLEGLRNTLIITVGALIIGVALGSIVAVLRVFSDGNRKLGVLNRLCRAYDWLMPYYVYFSTLPELEELGEPL